MPRRAARAWGSVDSGTHRRANELRNHFSRMQTTLRGWECSIRSCVNASSSGIRRSQRTWHVRTLYARESGDPDRARIGGNRCKGSIDEGEIPTHQCESSPGVGQRHRTGEVAEQRSPCTRGGDGGKGADQEERRRGRCHPAAELGRGFFRPRLRASTFPTHSTLPSVPECAFRR